MESKNIGNDQELISNPTFGLQNQMGKKHTYKNLDLSDKMDLDLWDCLGRVKLVL